MSLINDALRRARQTTADAPAAPPPPPVALDAPAAPPRLESAEPAPLSPWASLAPVLLIGFLVMVFLAVGGWFGWRAWNNQQAKKAAQAAQAERATRVVQVALPTPKTNPPAALARTNALVAAPARTAITPLSPALLPTNAQTVVVAPPPPPPPPVKWPSLKLQGIFYKPRDPSVVINNKTLYLSDSVEGVRVAGIDLYKVVLVLGGQTNVMSLR